MSEQLFLPGFDDPAVDNLFLAVLPDRPAAEQAGAISRRLCRRYGLTGRPLGPRRLHVSLHGLGVYAGIPNDVVARASDAAAAVTEASFEIAFDRASSFSGARARRPLVLRGHGAVDPLFPLHRALAAALARTGFERISPSFTPHMTLLYDVQQIPPCETEPVVWTVREIVLIHSRLGLGQHIPLGRWPLRP